MDPAGEYKEDGPSIQDTTALFIDDPAVDVLRHDLGKVPSHVHLFNKCNVLPKCPIRHGKANHTFKA